MNRLDAIRSREKAATPGPWEIPDGDLNGRIFAVGPIAGYDYDALEISDADAGFVSHSRADIPLLLAVAEAAAAYLVADKAWKDVRDDDDMDEDEVNDLWRAETDAYIALEAAVAPLLIEVTE